MFKKVLSFICALALVLGMLVPLGGTAQAATVAETASNICPACGATVTAWETWTADTTPVSGGHYRMAADVSDGQQSLNTAGTYCYDLAGHTLTSSSRAFLLGVKGSTTAVILNLMDSSADKTGKVKSSYTSGSGAAFYLYSGTEMNLYGGTVSYKDTDRTNADIGGAFQLLSSATLNVYGGTIEGTTVSTRAGAINMGSGCSLNLYGGTITSGTAPLANCVYVHSGAKVKLSGDANVGEIYFAGTPASCFTISGTYTGTVLLDAATPIASGDTIAVSNNADVTNANISAIGLSGFVAVSDNSVIMNAGAWCEACQKTVNWQPLSAKIPNAAGHYKLTKDVSAAQVSLDAIGGAICLDLAGYKYSSSGRVALLYDKSGDSTKDTLSIMDSSEGKTGIVIGHGGGTSHASGMFRTYGSTYLNLYDVTLQLVDNGNVVANDGGAIYVGSVVNMYGGKIIGGNVHDLGGAVYVAGTFNMTDGVIISGSAANLGDCVYVADGGKVTLSGNASPEQIYFGGSSASALTVKGTYTGKTELAYGTTPAVGTDVGNSTDAVFGKESISIADTALCVTVSGSNLVVEELTGTAVTDTEGVVTYYDTLAEAVAACKASDTVRLLADNSENVTIADCTVDLYGYDLKGNVTVTGTLYLKDSATDDFTVNDIYGYGKVSGTITGNASAAEGYMPLQETDGTSYHKFVLELTKVNLRPGNTGIYYTGDILLDEAVADKLDRYGIAVSTQSAVPSADPADATSLYTAYTKAQYGNADASSVLIQNIMDGEASDAVNAATVIYARPYMLLADGTYIYGKIAGTSMQKVAELVDKQVSSLKLPQFRAVTAMFDSYEATVSSWNVPNLIANNQAAETAANDRVLKVLVIGNSHGLDSTNLLYEVFKAEGLPEEYDNLILGAIYTGGCSVSTHAKNALGSGTYDYWKKNDGTDPNGAWQTFQDPTMHEVLINEDWDVVLLQEMNTSSARAEYFQNSNIETVFTVVTNTLGYEPQFMWNMIWANPEIPESYVNYLYKDGDDGSGSDVGSGSEGDDNDTSDAATIARRLAWIFQTQQPSALETWGKNYVKLWENNRQVMYNNIVSNVHNYIVGKEVHNIGMDDVMVNATAIQYAIEWMGMHDQDMYRDYTHVSDLGRLVVSYLWYAKLTGKTSIGDPNYTLVSQSLENSRQPLGYARNWSAYSDVIKNSVNFALADPYGVIQNLTYAEYLALSAEEQAAYKASFDSFSVASGWTYDMWLEQAIEGVTYTDYARMTDEQKTAFQALCPAFDTWYQDVVEDLRYAEYFLLTAEEKAAYEALRGADFATWYTAARDGFAYSEYVMYTYEQQQAYQATFASADDFTAHYEQWRTNMTYEEYWSLTMHQKLRYKNTYSSTAKFLEWYNAARTEGSVLEGKKVIFFGNSHTYYGRVVTDQAQDTTHSERINDNGLFYQLCKANGVNVNVTNYVFGNHKLSDFYSGSCAAGRGHDGHNHMADIPDFYYDYVILQQGAGMADHDLVAEVENMIAPFKAANPNVKVVFLLHLRSFTDGYEWKYRVNELEAMGVTVVDWGGMLYGLMTGTQKAPGSIMTYNKNTFIISQSATDGYHPNLLTGWLITQMTYCAITGEDASDLQANLGTDNNIIGTSALTKYRSKYYTYSTETNFDTIVSSEPEMRKLQALIDKWLAEKSYRDYTK